MSSASKEQQRPQQITLTPELVARLENPADVQRIHQSLIQEFQSLQVAFAHLKEADNRFATCISALGSITAGTGEVKSEVKSSKDCQSVKLSDDGEMMIPITESLFYRGQLLPRKSSELIHGDTSCYLVDIGTGVHVEKTSEEARVYYAGKRKMLGEQAGMVEARLMQTVPIVKACEERFAQFSNQNTK